VQLDREAIRSAALERALPAAEPIDTTIAALLAGRHVLLIGSARSGKDSIAEAVISAAADRGVCDGAISMPARIARLLTPADVLADMFRHELWWFVRSADAAALRRVADYVRVTRSGTTRPGLNWRTIVTTELRYADVARSVVDAAVNDFALVVVGAEHQ
jgi:hypothetical protein